jgi:hypothetical protein
VARGPLIPVKELVKRHHSRGAAYDWNPLDGFDTNANVGIYVMLLEGDSFISEKKKADKEDIYDIAEELGIKVYGVLSRQSKKLPAGWTILEDHLLLKQKEIEADANYLTYTKHGFPNGTIDDILGELYDSVKAKKDLLVDQKGLTIRFIELVDKVADGERKAGILRVIQKFTKQPVPANNFDDTLEVIKEDFVQKYPLIGIINGNRSGIYSHDRLAEEIITYINAKDAQEKEEENESD